MFLGQLFMLFQPIPLPTLYLLCVFTVGVGTFTVTLAAWCADGVSALALEQANGPSAHEVCYVDTAPGRDIGHMPPARFALKEVQQEHVVNAVGHQ